MLAHARKKNIVKSTNKIANRSYMFMHGLIITNLTVFLLFESAMACALHLTPLSSHILQHTVKRALLRNGAERQKGVQERLGVRLPILVIICRNSIFSFAVVFPPPPPAVASLAS